MRLRLLDLVAVSALLVPIAAPAHAGAAKPGKHPAPLDVTLVGRFVDGDQEILAFRPKMLPFAPEARVVLEQPAGRPTPWSGLSNEGGTTILVRRQIPPAGEKQSVVIQPRPDEAGASTMRFVIPDAGAVANDPTILPRWLRSLRDTTARIPDAFAEHARLRLDELLRRLESGGGKSGGKPATNVRVGVADGRRRADPSSLRELMDTTTGLLSMREALQTDRQLRTRFATEKPTVPIATVAGPRLAQHPWPEMLTALGRNAPDEPLAHAAPARFYYLRFASLAHLFRVLDEADAWITPAASISSGFAQNQELGRRYEAQLGLSRSLASRVLGAQVVTDVAVVGSDPYLREGSDLTFIFRIKSPTAFAAGLASTLAGQQAEHGKQTVGTLAHGGQTITVTRSEDGVVRQHRATVGQFHLVSNSAGAIAAVIDTIAGKSPALADAPDFRYLMARDAAVPADVLGFLSDAFVAEVVGPRQKILESRRMLAQADLLVPGYSALLFGFMFGRPPRSLDELIGAGLLGRDDLAHVSGEPIGFLPGSAARSSWGTVASLTPLIDLPALPAVPKVTETERDAYRMFADSYQRNWSQYMDPVALRLTAGPDGRGPLRADLRVLPIIDASNYREIQHTVGEARVEVPALAGGALVALGVGPQAQIRRVVAELGHQLPRGLRSQLDWLGELAFVGVDDRFNVKALLDAYNDERRLREPELARLLVEAPIYAGVAVRNALTAGLTLGMLRQLATDAAPGAIDWSERGKHRGIPYVGISAARGGEAHQVAGDLTLSYGFCKQHLLLSLSLATLKARIDDCLDGRMAKTAARGTPAAAQPPQLVVALALKKGGPLWQLLGAGIGLAADEAQQNAQRRGELLVRGAPGLEPIALRRLGMAYLGGMPVDANAREPVQPAATSRHRHHPRLVVPPEGSPALQFVAALARLRSELAFDQEVTLPSAPEPLQSLHVVLSAGTTP